jgi:hypothetical protein
LLLNEVTEPDHEGEVAMSWTISLALLDLPEDVKVKLLEDDDIMKGMSIREALRTARAATG